MKKKKKKKSQKNKVVTGETPFFVIGPFCGHHFICKTNKMVTTKRNAYANFYCITLKIVKTNSKNLVL